MADAYRSYTASERRQRAGLVLRGIRQAAAGAVAPAIERRIDRIDATAEDRGRREALALVKQHEQAKDDLATARARERAARRQDRQGARQAREAAEQRVRATERAIRRAGL